MSEVKIQAKYKAYDCFIFLIINGLMLKKILYLKGVYFSNIMTFDKHELFIVDCKK